MYSPLPFYDEDEDDMNLKTSEILWRRKGLLLYRRRFLCEIIGSFLNVFVNAGGHIVVVIGEEHGKGSRGIDFALASGFLSTALSFSFGNISGAHFNPLTTLSFALRGVFPWKLVPPYILAQAIGSFLAALSLRLVFGAKEYVGANIPVAPSYIWAAVYMEVILTMLLVLVNLSVSTRHKLLGPTAGIAVGSAQGLCVLIGSPISGASMNPMRSIASAAASAIRSDDLYALQVYWIYLAGPLVGMFLALVFMIALNPARKAEEIEHAAGLPSAQARNPVLEGSAKF